MPGYIERKPPPTGDNGSRTPQHVIDDMRACWLRGDPIALIATWFGVEKSTVNRWCDHLPRPKRQRPLTTSEIDGLMRRWLP